MVAGGGPGTDKVHASRWVGEFNLDERGQLFATPMESVLAAAKAAHDVYPERDKRGIPVLIGTTVSFVRQLFGRPVTHYFFSSRIQLPTKAITLLEKNIGDWTQGITFEPTDRNITQNGGTSVVAGLGIRSQSRCTFTRFRGGLKRSHQVHDPDRRPRRS